MGIVVPGEGAEGHCVAQVYGPAVGAYITSVDLPDGSPGMRQMIAAQYNFPPGVRPFLTSTSVVGLSYDLQVPTASDDPGPNAISNSYAKHAIVLVDDNGGRIAYSFNSFSNGNFPKKDGSGFDTLTNTAICTSLLGPNSLLSTLLPGSAAFRNTPWRGWATYAMTFSYQQFLTGIQLAQTQATLYGVTLSKDPAAYSITETHMNAELHYTPQNPATLGWSMRNLLITQVSS